MILQWTIKTKQIKIIKSSKLSYITLILSWVSVFLKYSSYYRVKIIYRKILKVTARIQRGKLSFMNHNFFKRTKSEIKNTYIQKHLFNHTDTHTHTHKFIVYLSELHKKGERMRKIIIIVDTHNLIYVENRYMYIYIYILS